ncbi:uncharacterized protein K452DRAFT_32246 [Aplosporella prunicola CBS 121167]|uniref:YTH domain-containing protein n=1 Tax=Aplosporella prunicola CBS 121167 TaxID=1176127 RepID=A0A6A6BCA4_9PEZI|nr:uncharacterized protein K452DRAFT_32246 [Aplosporella prunicola CBS 121167]KAF2141686.1 hypothetical protein K452DRAFT_32246 [Aplosporella prunicola CBS 121167]
MGDVSIDGVVPPVDSTPSHEDARLLSKPSPGCASNSTYPTTAAPFHSQYSSLPDPNSSLEVQRPFRQQNAYAYTLPSAQGPSPPVFNMTAVAGALPDYSTTIAGHAMPTPVQPVQRGVTGASTPALVYQLQQISQYPGQAAMGYASQPSFGAGFAPSQFATAYHTYLPGQQRAIGPAQLPQPYAPYSHQPPQYMYYAPPYGNPGSMSQSAVAYAAPRVEMDGRRASLSTAPGSYHTDGSMIARNYLNMNGSVVAQGIVGDSGTGAPAALGTGPALYAFGSDASLTAIPRGPPRKPKQSGHALWVGNLPPGTTVVDLKDHFSRDATKDIESLFLISKSNCAFVNYRTEASCTAAMHRFHDSRFHGVRLVCRLRRSAAPASGVPTGPSAMSVPRQSNASPEVTPVNLDEENGIERGEPPAVDGLDKRHDSVTKVAEKFFIVKSLTLQDLELSVRNGTWATQAHNEQALNEAYESAENVYLIFSANKSGEYFGYARMASPIAEDATVLKNSTPETRASEAVDNPKSIPTPATEYAPKGRVIDDSARGTIFWEADQSDEEDADKVDGVAQSVTSDASNPSQAWGKPFKVEWLSTNRLPFYRTRGLRNPWNANREVKIARDGTELETSVGKRLIQMFHRLGPSTAGPPMVPMMHMPAQPIRMPL